MWFLLISFWFLTWVFQFQFDTSYPNWPFHSSKLPPYRLYPSILWPSTSLISMHIQPKHSPFQSEAIAITVPLIISFDLADLLTCSTYPPILYTHSANLQACLFYLWDPCYLKQLQQTWLKVCYFYFSALELISLLLTHFHFSYCLYLPFLFAFTTFLFGPIKAVLTNPLHFALTFLNFIGFDLDFTEGLPSKFWSENFIIRVQIIFLKELLPSWYSLHLTFLISFSVAHLLCFVITFMNIPLLASTPASATTLFVCFSPPSFSFSLHHPFRPKQFFHLLSPLILLPFWPFLK